ncbi:TPA: MarR family transcriptional regulator [bacterium]|jgi:DNA-binding MarR family transcriptional regulator|nr:MarR family transcriptional regulator [bacterium]
MNNEYNPEQSLFSLIRRTSKAFREKVNQNFAKEGHDVTGEQWRILWCLWGKDGQIQQNLADVVHRDKTCITRIVDSMEKRDLVVRIPDRLDRRQNLIYLTNKGKRLQEDLMRIFDETSLEAQKGIDTEELDIFKKVLMKILQNLTGI